jgi:hypothetical protein
MALPTALNRIVRVCESGFFKPGNPSSRPAAQGWDELARELENAYSALQPRSEERIACVELHKQLRGRLNARKKADLLLRVERIRRLAGILAS